jgi:hypothetical protein
LLSTEKKFFSPEFGVLMAWLAYNMAGGLPDLMICQE